MLIGRRPHVSKKTKEVVWQAAGLTLEEGILKCEMCHLTSPEMRRVWRGGSGSGSPSWTWRCSRAGRDVYEVITRFRYTQTKSGWWNLDGLDRHLHRDSMVSLRISILMSRSLILISRRKKEAEKQYLGW